MPNCRRSDRTETSGSNVKMLFGSISKPVEAVGFGPQGIEGRIIQKEHILSASTIVEDDTRGDVALLLLRGFFTSA